MDGEIAKHAAVCFDSEGGEGGGVLCTAIGDGEDGGWRWRVSVV